MCFKERTTQMDVNKEMFFKGIFSDVNHCSETCAEVVQENTLNTYWQCSGWHILTIRQLLKQLELN